MPAQPAAPALSDDDRAAPAKDRAFGRTVVYDDELLRYPAYARVLHWLVAIFFVLALLTGLAIYSPWIFQWLTPLFGGGAMTRMLHPWFSLAFVAVFAAQLVNWLDGMRWKASDREWFRHMKDYVTNREPLEPDYVGFGQAPSVSRCRGSAPATPSSLRGRRGRRA